MIGQEQRLAVIAHAHFVGVLFAGKTGSLETVADFHTLHGVDRHQQAGNILIELAVDRRPDTSRHTFSDNLDDCADRRSALANAIKIVCEQLDRTGIRREERVVVHFRPVPATAVDTVHAHGHQRALDLKPRHDLARYGACCHTSCRFARRRTSAAAIVANAVFDVIGIIGMTGTILTGNFAIILRALIGVLDHHRNRRASRRHGHAIVAQKNTGKHANLIRFAALRRIFGLAGLALVEIGLNFGFRERNAGRAAVNNATERQTVAFAPGGYAEQMTETIVRHARRLNKLSLSGAGQGESSYFTARFY